MSYTTEQLTLQVAATEIVKQFTDAEAVFYAGTLFVQCDSRTAVRIQTALMEQLKCGVIISKIGSESSFDFC